MMYALTAPTIWRHLGLSTVLTCELYWRARAGIFGPNQMTRALYKATWDEAGYCLDAPDELPGGGCRSDDFPPEDDLPGLPQQITVDREA